MLFKCKFIKNILLCAACLAAAVAITLAVKQIPGIVTYDVKPTGLTSQNVKAGPDTQPLYNSLEKITQNGPFLIKSFDGNVYVFCENTCLYMVSAPLRNFTESDKSLLTLGVTAESYMELCEMVEYLEG